MAPVLAILTMALTASRTAVIERQIENQPPVVAGAAHGFAEDIAPFGRESVYPPGGNQFYIVLVEFFDFAQGGSGQQRHEGVHFLFGPIPVLHRERKQRQVLDTYFAAGLHHLTHRLDARLVTERARFVARFGPTAVAVHDNGDMLRYPVGPGLYLILDIFQIR